MENRKCEKCGAVLTDEDVMKIMMQDGTWETIPLPLCPKCFASQMRELAHTRRKRKTRPSNVVDFHQSTLFSV